MGGRERVSQGLEGVEVKRGEYISGAEGNVMNLGRAKEMSHQDKRIYSDTGNRTRV